MEVLAPSKNAVRKAGSCIRAFHRGDATDQELDDALAIMRQFRSKFSGPLVKVNNSLRAFATSLEIECEVTQRLKKSRTIFEKLAREPGLDLSRMQDIGGCRAVFETVDDLRKFESRVCRTWSESIHHDRDYIAEPRESGYRAVHVVVTKDGCFIEVQLRTTSMHRWAETVEAFSATTSTNFKQDGDHAVQEYMKMVSILDQHRESGTVMPQSQLDRMGKLGEEVLEYLKVQRVSG